MKKLLAVMFALLLVPFSTQSYKAVENNQPDLVALGDSITKGYGLNDGEKCYVDILADECGFNKKNFAVNGQTSLALLKTLQDISDDEREALINADYIVISIGGNDMMYILNNLVNGTITSANERPDQTVNKLLEISEKLTPENMKSDIQYYKKNVEKIINIIRELNKDASITFQTVYNPFKAIFVVAPVIFSSQADQIKDAQDKFDNCIDGFNTALLELSEKYDLNIADVCSNFKNSDEKLVNMSLSNPDIHPNAAGHRRIAELVSAVMDSSGKYKLEEQSIPDTSKKSKEVIAENSKSESSGEISTKSEHNVENSSESSSSDIGGMDESQRFYILIGGLAVISFVVTFSRLKHKSKK